MKSAFSKSFILCIISTFLMTNTILSGQVFAEKKSVIPWTELTQEEQKLLNRYSDTWQGFSPKRQDRLRRGARRWRETDFNERKLARKRMELWEKISPENRENIRNRFEEYQQLPETEREKLVKARRWFMKLPFHKQKDLRRLWKRISRKTGL